MDGLWVVGEWKRRPSWCFVFGGSGKKREAGAGVKQGRCGRRRRRKDEAKPILLELGIMFNK
jgi:hypothetical protein